MGSSTKKHKTRESEKDRSKKNKKSRSPERRHSKHKDKRHKRKRETYESDSSDCVEVPISEAIPAPPPPPKISKLSSTSTAAKSVQSHSKSSVSTKPARESSPIPENGAGDCLSIDETNKLRAKLGLKPLENAGPVTESVSRNDRKDKTDNDKRGDKKPHNKYKDDYGEFYHTPASNIAKTTAAAKLRDKLKEKKEKRDLESKLLKNKNLGASDSEEEDAKKWINKTRELEKSKKEAEKRAKVLEEMDQEFGIDELLEKDSIQSKKQSYKEKHLKGLRVEHDMDAFIEGKQIILTLKDQDVLGEDGDALVNVNMLDDERYKKSNENKKQTGYNAFEDEDLDELGMPKMRSILKKYDEEIEPTTRTGFQIGRHVEEEIRKKRKLLEIKAKLQNKRIDSLDTLPLTLAADCYNDDELASFKKPNKKIRKIRQKLKADDLLAIVGDTTTSKDFGSRNKTLIENTVADDSKNEVFATDMNMEVDDDLEQMLAKARRLKQQNAVITKSINDDSLQLKTEVKSEPDSDEELTTTKVNKETSQIVLNATAEFCRTLGDIPTYGQAGNRDCVTDIDFDEEINDKMPVDDDDSDVEIHGTWNSVDADAEMRSSKSRVNDLGETAILDEEPDVASGVGAALRLAMSKGYLEKEESNRPSNSRFAHLQAKNYSIEDKAYGDDDKYSRRDRYSGPLSEFREKETFKPNVKLEYIDDNGHLLSAKEAFRYLSHKFHGKGPGKNKIEKRLKKGEQEGLMKKMPSSDTPLGTLNMLQAKQKETQSPFVVLSGSKMQAAPSISKQKR